MAQKKIKLVIEAWPQLIEALTRQPMLGDTPEEVAKFLIINGLDVRERERASNRRAGHEAYANGYRGGI